MKQTDRNSVELKLKALIEMQSLANSFAFQYRKSFPYEDSGWNLYKPIEFYTRMIENYTINNRPAWVISSINNKYEFSETYPSCLVVPAQASDEDTLKKVGLFRSKSRIPSLCWKHPTKPITLSRCSQPKVGITFNSSEADRNYIEAIRLTNNLSSTLYFVDARPKVSAIGNVLAAQGGYEYDYKNTAVSFLNIDNIHAMRNAWMRLLDVLSHVFNQTDDSKWYTEIDSTNWLSHIKTLLIGASEIVKIIENTNSSVVLHCSDGWDRTAQLSSLVQLMIDPFFRTLNGLIILIEKEWCSFGHKFAQRGGHEVSGKKKRASNEKSPIFIQWLESVWQLLVQFPEAFQYNEEFLICLADALYECRFGTFLEDSEKARKENCQPYAVSLWTWVNLEENKKTLSQSTLQ